MDIQNPYHAGAGAWAQNPRRFNPVVTVPLYQLSASGQKGAGLNSISPSSPQVVPHPALRWSLAGGPALHAIRWSIPAPAGGPRSGAVDRGPAAAAQRAASQRQPPAAAGRP